MNGCNFLTSHTQVNVTTLTALPDAKTGHAVPVSNNPKRT